MDDLLFDIDEKSENEPAKDHDNHAPLAARLRPETFDDFYGQDHLVSEGKLLRKSIESDTFSSIILYGPPGTGKTSLAEIIARMTDSVFVRLSGVISKVTDLRKEIATAVSRRHGLSKKRTIVFIDEIHRFNRAQQDSLLPDIENGNIRFIGATTQNPYFFIVSPLLSRSLVFNLKLLSKEEIRSLVARAISDPKGLAGKVEIEEDALDFLCQVCEGDARRSLNTLELSSAVSEKRSGGKILIDLKTVQEAVQKKSVNYGKDEHYDTISAFIKSMRGSDVDAAIYYLAKMLSAGEDIMFIARRIVIFASEDIGNSDPRAVELTTSIMKAVEMIGMPEAKILLAQAVTYCATAPKSNASYRAISEALEDIENNRIEVVPVYLRSKYCPSSDEKISEKYKYSHDYKDHYSGQDYMGVNKIFYHPGDIGFESKIKERIAYWKNLKEEQKSKI